MHSFLQCITSRDISRRRGKGGQIEKEGTSKSLVSRTERHRDLSALAPEEALPVGHTSVHRDLGAFRERLTSAAREAMAHCRSNQGTLKEKVRHGDSPHWTALRATGLLGWINVDLMAEGV